MNLTAHPPVDPVLSRWLHILNENRDEASARALLPEDVEVDVLPQGKGGPTKRYSGIAAALTWLQRAKPGLYRFEALSEAAGEPHPGLPVGARALCVRYRVWATSPESDWQNWGDWVLHIADGADPAASRIVGVFHSPDALLE
jgi:hypothetical protein